MSPSEPVRITNPDDPRIALFREVKERDRVGREGVFIAEGQSVLTVLLTRSPLDRLAILVDERRADRLDVLAHRGATPLYVAPQKVLNAIAGFDLHRGILAAGRIPPSAALDGVGSGPLALPVLVNLANHDNVGGIYRNAAAFGAAAVAIDPTTADPFYRKAIRVGVGAPLFLPTIRTGDPVAFCAELAAHAIVPYALTPSARRHVGAAPLAPRAAFLLGTEGAGLPAPLLAAAEPLAIDIASGFDSLNVAAASAIALHAHRLEHGGDRPLADPS
ncbi:TrmH family RNA methyltransferase [Acuticoccus mangrovi]|uniref:RNA methyltransferase n=1 Tax=Acuticoccus mangrovi TaxID=2796142 RepID=A0A934MFY4_9HYPH|nr:TrmH family RNA methyltransferase [Acuticoccus mangrovi]MBJ3774371.1 RNA methyltransferase [Acuticoccus mangrovi]